MKIILNSRDEIMSVDLDKVVYFLADGNFTRIILENKMILTCGIGLAKMEEILAEQIARNPSCLLVRTGKSHIINIQKIILVNVLKQQVLLAGDNGQAFTVKVSREAAKGLKQLVAKTKIQ